MKKLVLSLVIVFVFAATAHTQEVKPSGMWLNLFFPEVKEYMDTMQAQINRMEATINSMSTQINDLRNDYVKYQHDFNGAIFEMALASAYFGEYISTRDIDIWNRANDDFEGAFTFLDRSRQYWDKLGLEPIEE